MRLRHRVSKGELKEDKFQRAVEKIAELYYADTKRFWIGIGFGLIVVVGIILLVQNRPRPVVNPEAELRLMDALGNYFQGNNDYAEQAFKELATRFGRDYAGIKARYYLGSIYLHSQPPRVEEAKREFSVFIKKAKDDPVLSPAALIGLAICEEKLGNYARAGKIYESVYRRYPQSPLGFEGMMQAGRCYRQAGMLDRAEKIYEELLEKEKPTGARADDVRIELAFIRALKNRL